MPNDPRRPLFERPPVVEVACGVQFEGLIEWRTTHYGQFWTTIKDQFPETEDHPPLPRVRPTLTPTPPFQPEWSPLPPLRRVFFIKPPGNFLIQLQQNRLFYNWRKVADSDDYPRFEAPLAGFRSAWAQFNHFTSEAGLPTPAPEIWELTYINHILDEGAQFPRDVWEYLGFYEKSPEATPPTPATAMAIQFVWPLENESGLLTLDVKHGNRLSDRRDVLIMELTVRGPAKGGSNGIEPWFEIAHQHIVNTFDKLTTRRAHQLWGEL